MWEVFKAHWMNWSLILTMYLAGWSIIRGTSHQKCSICVTNQFDSLCPGARTNTNERADLKKNWSVVGRSKTSLPPWNKLRASMCAERLCYATTFHLFSCHFSPYTLKTFTRNPDVSYGHSIYTQPIQVTNLRFMWSIKIPNIISIMQTVVHNVLNYCFLRANKHVDVWW